MKIAIIGAGFTGLSAAYELAKKGHDVTVFEKDSLPGGLAIGYKEKGWDWTLEKHYHHWFSKDKFVLGLAKEIGHEVILKRTKTCVFVKNQVFQLDGIKGLLNFPYLTLYEKFRMGIVLGFLRVNPIWKPLEKIRAHVTLPKLMGRKAYDMIWGSQLVNKMGEYAKNVSLVWFWARIFVRTPELAYPEGGFLHFAKNLANAVQKKGGKIYYNTASVSIEEKNNQIYILLDNGKEQIFDKVIFTLPSFLFLQQAKQLPESYIKLLSPLKGLAATNLVLRFKKQFFKDNTYWLSICDTSSPLMVAVEHTNFMDAKHYNNEHIVYLGKYMKADSDRFSMNKEKTLELYDEFLKTINPDYKKELIDYELFKAPFAQPIVPVNYSHLLPPFDTPISNLYLANMQQVYPWDRGTNYAVELGQKISTHISKTV